MRLVMVVAAAMLVGGGAACANAQSVAYHFEGAYSSSSGQAGDPGLGRNEQMVTTFDGNDRLTFDATRSRGFGYFTGRHEGHALAPAGDTSQYAAIGAGGSMLFDLRQFNSPSSVLSSISVHVGSIDIYNFVDILGLTATGDIDYDHPVFTLSGADLLKIGRDGRLRFGFDNTGGIGGIVFRSSGIAFEFDSLAVGVDNHPAWTLTAPSVPEPASWALMLGGFGTVGSLLRRQRRAARQALPHTPRTIS